MKYEDHPLYQDADAAKSATQWLIDGGHTTFQLFQFGTEEVHAKRMLDLVNPPINGSVLSLGCGVGGMERLWQTARPDLTFELVNLCQSQLEMCVCDGSLVLADANEYRSEKLHDVVVVAYMLGHADAVSVMNSAFQNAAIGATILVADVFGTPPEFDEQMLYGAPSLDAILGFAKTNGLTAEVISDGLVASEFIESIVPAGMLGLATPLVVVLRNCHAGR